MVLRLANDEVQEVQRALSAVHSEVLRELNRLDGFFSPDDALNLCRRKWKLEALLHQLNHSNGHAPGSGVVPSVKVEQQ